MTTITHSLSKSLFSVSRAQHGFTYIGLLFFVVIVTFALSGLATAWHTKAQREREAELLFVGEQFRRAIESYFLQSPGRSKLPASLDDLLLDERHPVTKRHLRRLYRDPMTGSTEWGLVRIGDGIAGVYSLSDGRPFRTARFQSEQFAEAETYQDWKFVFVRRTRRTVR
ncbi:MAG: type II secretion system protein [Betaproteobacteria bacterium]|nr:MAG: type II secretion system protein [Betaproteobacteria bacterium]